MLERRKLKLLLKIQRRRLKKQGGHEAEVENITLILQNPDGLDLLNDYCCDMMEELPAAPTSLIEIFEWIIEHWEEIYQIILTIISLFEK